MGEMQTDYLWLRQGNDTQPRSRFRYRLPLTLLISAAAIAAVASWFYAATGAQTAPPAAAQSATIPAPSVAAKPDAGIKRNDAPAAQNHVAAVAFEQTIAAETGAPRTALRFEPSMRLLPTANLRYNPRDVSADDDWIDITIHQGDTLSSAFARHNLSYSDSLAIAGLPQYGSYFTTGLRAGDSFRIKVGTDGHVIALKDPLSPARTLKIQATADGFAAEVEEVPLEKRIAYATGVINSSFYNDALEAGLTPAQVMALADLLKWEVDFAYGVRPGDRFTVVYSELYKDGRKVADGHILAASFDTSDQLIRALRFTGYENETNYYRPDGSSLKRAFIRVPVDYTRISSPFSMARDHPILDRVRAHEGTDYAAPMGTPIHAAGAGRIIMRGRNGGYGNMVAIDHGRGITTRYGHMSRFARGQHVGSRVTQGEVIGYVGSTGLSTGPHLHYEFRINGVPKNSQTVDLPGAPPLPDEYMDEFKAHVTPLLAKLDAASHTMLASNQQ